MTQRTCRAHVPILVLALALAGAPDRGRSGTPPPVRPSTRGPRPFSLLPPPGLKAVDRPARVLCEVGTDQWVKPAWGSSLDLAAAPGAARFVTVTGGAVRLLVPATATAPLMVEAESGGLYLRGHLVPAAKPHAGLDPASFLVHPALAMAVGGLYWPARGTVLELRTDARRGYVVGPVQPLSSSLKVAPGVLPAPVPCSALALEAPAQALGPPPPAGPRRQVQLKPGSTLPLLDRPGGSTLATIAVPRGRIERLLAYRARDGHTPITLEVAGGVVTGWIESRRLAAAEEPVEVDGIGGLFGTPDPPPGFAQGIRRPDPRLVCDDDVPVILEVPAAWGHGPKPTRVVVGGYRRGTSIAIDGRGAETTRLYLTRYATFRFADPGRMLLPNVALQACRSR